VFTGDFFFITRFIVIIFIATVVLLFLYTRSLMIRSICRVVRGLCQCVGAVYNGYSDHSGYIYYTQRWQPMA